MSKEDSSGEGKSHASMADTPADVPTKDRNADIYENRGQKKIIRVVTVMAYLFSVSFVGIVLSAYYIFLWEPPNPRLIQRERLRTDPQLQFLIAPPSEKTDVTKKDSSFLLQSEVNHVHEPFLGRMTQDTYDGDGPAVDSQDEVNFPKRQRLNAILRKLRHSLVGAQRAQNRNSSQEAAITSGLDNSTVKVEEALNTTMDRTISRSLGESRGNISEEKTRSDNADLPVEFADSVSTLNIQSTPSTSKFMTIPGTETSQRYFHRDSVTNANPIIEGKNRYRKKKLDAVKSYFVPGLRNATTNSDVTNSSGRRDVFGDNSSSKVIQKLLKIVREKSMKSNETDDRRLVNSDRKNDPGDVQTSVMLDERVNGSIRNSQGNYSSDNESSSKDQIGQIARDRVSIDLSSRDSGFTDDPGFHQTPDDSTLVKSRPRTMGTRNSEGERIHADLSAFLRRRDKHGRAKRDRVIIQ